MPVIVKLTKNELNDLKIFLGRTELKGTEVPAYVKVMNQLNKAQEMEITTLETSDK